MAIANAKMVTGHKPTYIPSISCPENQRAMEYRKLKKARIIG
jgi:hypothetical protein